VVCCGVCEVAVDVNGDVECFVLDLCNGSSVVAGGAFVLSAFVSPCCRFGIHGCRCHGDTVGIHVCISLNGEYPEIQP
jgi:hypothetical protein